LNFNTLEMSVADYVQYFPGRTECKIHGNSFFQDVKGFGLSSK